MSAAPLPARPSIVAWVERSIGPDARVLRITQLSESHRLVEAEVAGARRRFVLRAYHDCGRLRSDPWYDPAAEAAALELLAGSEVPAPRLLAADLVGNLAPEPVLLESWISGESAWNAEPGRLIPEVASALMKIHSVTVPAAGMLRSYATYSSGFRRIPRVTSRPELWLRVHEVLDLPAPSHRDTFIHRDFHPGNILWDGTRLTGIIDWATASFGPPGIDLARMRLSIAARDGQSAADGFARAYRDAGGDPAARHPWWDLLDAADFMLDVESPHLPGGGDLARFEDYVKSVLAELEAS